MFELDAANAAGYLTSRGLAGPWRILPLGGGVSNTVLSVENSTGRLILKQSLGRLRVADEWLSDRSRALRECDALRTVEALLPPQAVPSILFEDPDNFLFAMTPAPADARDWKSLLLSGDVRPEIAGQAGSLLGALITASWRSTEFERRFGDQRVFDQLRLDPYYRTTARRHPDLAPFFDALIRRAMEHRVAFVHGDWSPKNLLISRDHVMAIDFEVAHFGDPSFDSAFLLNHLALKSFHMPDSRVAYAEAADRFWSALEKSVPPEAADPLRSGTVAHLAGLMLARVDGKSPAEYIRDDGLKARIRDFARNLMMRPPASAGAVFERLGA